LQVNTNFGPLVQQIKHHKMVKLLIEIVWKIYNTTSTSCWCTEIIKLYLIANYQIFTEWRNQFCW
jgi:hypothetical protein